MIETNVFLGELAREAGEEWSVPTSLARALFLAPFVGGVVVAAIRLSSRAFDFVTREDSILEWSQFAGYAIAAGTGLLVALRLARTGNRWAALAWLAFGVGCFFVAGEEISWGQRIFGFSTPETLQAVNAQGEANVHNIRTVLDGLNASLLVGGLFGAAAPWAVRRLWRDSPWRQEAWLFVPPLFLTSAFAVMFAYKTIRFTALRPARFTAVRYGEWAELCFAFALSAFALLVYRRLAAQRPR